MLYVVVASDVALDERCVASLGRTKHSLFFLLFSSFLFCSEKVLGHFFDTTSNLANIFNLKRAKEQHKLKDTAIDHGEPYRIPRSYF